LAGVQHDEAHSARHPGFHKTDTIDYALVLEGEVWAILDEAETLLKAGDVLIQRGTFHAWDNRSESVCRIAFILLDAVSD
jgi:quercetin dioxygenase-like cupin family protein